MTDTDRSIDPSPTVAPTDRFVARLEYVAMWLQSLAAQSARGLTDPDPKTGEQWEWGQVWAHLAEFVPYWMDQVRLVVREYETEPVPFGRVKTDSGRIAAIERDRSRPVEELMARLNAQLADLRLLIDDIRPHGWRKRGLHQTLGEMTVEQIVDEFLVGHLEEHQAQLSKLIASTATGGEAPKERPQ